MTKKKPTAPQTESLQLQLAELTADLQRTRADFENYRRRMDDEKQLAAATGATKTVLKLLPVIDTIERAILHVPSDIAEHQWVQGVVGLIKQLDKTLDDMDLHRIEASPGTTFDPSLHQAVQFDEASTGDHEVIAEQLQTGYRLATQTIRPSMVRVTRTDTHSDALKAEH